MIYRLMFILYKTSLTTGPYDISVNVTIPPAYNQLSNIFHRERKQNQYKLIINMLQED